MNQATILVVDDDQTFLESVSFALKSKVEVLCASNVSEAKKKLDMFLVDVVITDYRMNAGGDGHEIVKIAKSMTPSPPVILITAYASKEVAILSANLHVFSFLEKPVNLLELSQSVESAIQAKRQVEAISSCECFKVNSANDGIYLNENDYSVVFQGERFDLTKVEFRILTVFSESAGQRINLDGIMNQVWGASKMSPNLFHTHLRNMRRKLPFLSSRLKSVWGAGYIFSKNIVESEEIGKI
jgi:DNA-binding response OmpR family regulator